MKHNIFETRQRADELLNEAISIWKQSVHSEQLEGLEKDPVFGMLMSAIAYQANETDAEIERLKADVLADYSAMLTPYEMAHATPATIVAEMSADSTGVAELNSNTEFVLNDTEFRFTPVMHTRVVNTHIENITRIDGRRWNLDLKFDTPIKDLSLFTFSVANPSFRDLRITVNDKELPLIRPWEYSEMPMADNFKTDTAIYNSEPTYDASMTNMDLFARHGMRLYCIDKHNPKVFLPQETEGVRFTIEFIGTTEHFRLDRSQIHLNVTVLANATQHEVMLDPASPIARIAGNGSSHSQFMHMLRPDSTQIFGKEEVQVRRVMADRFNQGTLVRLLSSLLCKVHSDFYAFQYMDAKQTNNSVNILRESMQKLLQLARQDDANSVSGTYLMLKMGSEASLNVKYIATNGSAVNGKLTQQSSFTCISGNSVTARVLSYPINGTDEVSLNSDVAENIRYAIATNNRIVTMADIKAFCYCELQTRYGIMRDTVEYIRVKQQLQSADSRWHNACGYEILVSIRLVASPFVKRNFTECIPEAQQLIEKMMAVRSANIYPIKVIIDIDN